MMIRRFQHYFSYITTASAPILTFLEISFTNIFSKPLAAFHINFVETMVHNDRGMNPIVSPRKEIGRATNYHRTTNPLFSNPRALPTEPHGL